MAFAWTDELTVKAKDMYLGGMSATEIAKEFGGVSRSAVLGKLHRLGVTKKGDDNFREAIRIQALRRASADKERMRRQAERRAKAEERNRLAEERQAARMMLLADQRNGWKEIDMPKLVECSPRPWTERKFGECAYPVEGDGADIKSCCNPVEGSGSYCRGHGRIMFTPTEKREVKIPRGGLNFQNARLERDRDVEAELFFAA